MIHIAGYAVRSDLTGWREILDSHDIKDNEFFSETIVQLRESLVRVISIEEFRNRFTEQQFASVVASNDVRVKVLLGKVYTRQTPIDLDSQQVIDGLSYLVSIGILQDLSAF